MPTPQQIELEQRRSLEDERKLREREWRDAARTEDVSFRVRNRDEDVAWRQSMRTEDIKWRETQQQFQSEERRLANRRSALMAASQSLSPGSSSEEVLRLAEHYAAWIASTER